MSTGPSEYLRAFLHDSVSSYEELEALLLLAREGGAWSESEVASSLKAPLDGIAGALRNLAQVPGLLQTHGQLGAPRFQYAPHSKLLRQVVEELAATYAEQRLTIVQLMSANALERARSAAARHLADSFRPERQQK